MPGEVLQIWIKRFKGGPMDAAADARLTAGMGIEGNANRGGRRQVTIIDEARWREAEAELGASVDPVSRRANLMLRGIDLERSNGKLLRVGSSVIRVFNETRPCALMDAMHPGLRAALGPRWRGGAFGEVVESGVIQVGDPARWMED